MLHLKGIVIDGAQNECDFTFRKGLFYSLLGDDDSGAPELFRTIAGLQAPASGRIVFGGRDITGFHPSKRGMITITSEPIFDMEQTVMENIMLFRSAERRIALEAADLMGLGNYVHRSCRKLDLGVLQRVSMARALTRKPQVLLLENPVDRLGFAEGLYCLQVLKEALTPLGSLILHFTGCSRAAMEGSDELIVVDDADFVEAGAPEALYYHPRTRLGAERTGEVNYISAVGVEQNHLQLPYGYPISYPPTRCRVQEKRPYTIMFRPEAPTLSTHNAPGCLAIPVQVKQCSFRRTAFRVELMGQLGEEFVVNSFEPLDIHQELMLNIPTARMHLMGAMDS
ncbi:ATP-binding cassette domain-containing protein [Desulfurispirillum indicum]|uniref:ABC transporter domain-containing protein n=1 Tax=Desulfurispirillum indicum (strain ATCC BAA-1389 / DSM 22839 / S5) TaxID=653733 RepID=E6W0N9_DESIS|nr:ATP-binding cassette domain-containing protein [Desulfurispirillum indicum]ADU65291.1 hypothetical protein Selin_0543 [Desulfurispirillum indicum S5]UCZ57188.1 ATP-binding cassette domain-containing protein [Desulfurispirillum indicum]